MKLTLHPLCGTTVRNWGRVFVRHGHRGMDWGRALQITALAGAAAPFRWYERLRWGRTLDAIEVREPIFVCGHWQSGHTLVQLLLACDPRLATLRLRHAVQPAACLTLRPLLRWLLPARLPESRVCDDLPIDLDAPQGDDFALGLLSDVSFYYAWYFPAQADAVFRRSVLMEGLPIQTLANWRVHYRRLLQKLLWESGRDRIVVRNACNTARIRYLLDAFPDARFVYCHRDPYEVFAAALERWHRLAGALAVDSTSLPQEELERLTLQWYQRLLKRYLDDREHIPPGQLAEVAYTDLQTRPIEAMQDVYTTFGLDDFEAARPHMQRLRVSHRWDLAGQEPLLPRQREAVAGNWAFAFHEWSYAF